MAKQKLIRDPQDNRDVQSYWIAGQFNMNLVDRSGKLIFLGFRSKEARDANKPHVDSKVYQITLKDIQDKLTPEQFIEFTDAVNTLRSYAYAYANAVKDGELKAGYSQNEDGEYIDPDGNVVDEALALPSFFEGATDV